MTQYKSLHYMLALQDNDCLASAAKQLQISQSSLSLYLARLEASFGTPLYDRKSHSLTDAGRIYCDGARKILSLHEKTLEDIKLHSSVLSIRFGIDICFSELSCPLVQELTDMFSNAHSQVNLQISFLHESELKDMLYQRKLDLGLAYFQRSGIERLEQREYMSEVLFLAVPPGFPVDSDSPYTVFENLDYISIFANGGICSACSALLFLHGAPAFSSINCGSYALACDLLRTGHYASIIPAGAAGLFGAFDLYPLDSSIQAESGFYIPKQAEDMSLLCHLMDSVKSLSKKFYKGNPYVYLQEEAAGEFK